MSSPYCSICHSIYAETETVVATQCGHIYHSQCISDWINSNAERPTCPKCRESCHNTKRIHLDFVNDDNLACAQAKQALAAGTVDEETIKTLFDSIESLTLDKQLAEKNLIEMKQLVKKINWIPEIQSEVLELNSMNSTVLELKNYIDELLATREGISTVLFHSQTKAKRILLAEKIESGIRQLIHILHNKRTEYVNAMYSKQNALRRVQELERDIVVNQNELNEKRKNEMENAKRRIEELRMTVSSKQIEIERIKAEVQDETRELREQNRIEVDSLRKELQDLSDMHINETRELREQNRMEIDKMHRQLKGLKSTHSGEMRKLREQSNIEMANLRNQIQDERDMYVDKPNSKNANSQAQMSNNRIQNKVQTQNQDQNQSINQQNQQNRNQNKQNRAPPRNNQYNKPNVGPSNLNTEIQAPAESQMYENQNQSQNLNSNRRNTNRRNKYRNKNNQNANRQNSESMNSSMPNNDCASNQSSHFDRPVTAPRRQFNNNRNFDNRRYPRGQTGQVSTTHQKSETPRRILA